LSLCWIDRIVSRCHLLVGNDSGPLHLARTVGASTL
jgi:ADP-heptose:LPS heptosyltransferase